MLSQRTIRNKITATGVGLHSGKKVTLTFHPADVNTGIIFRRIEGDKVIEIPALAKYVGDTTLSTSLERDGYKISTIEHLLSAIAGTGVDNCVIDCDGPEIPVMDGSSTEFVFLIQSAGIMEQDAAKKFIYVTKSVQVSREDAVARINPYEGFRVTFTVDFDHPVYKKYPQSASIDFSQTSFIREVSRARTFGLMNDLEKLKANSCDAVFHPDTNFAKDTKKLPANPLLVKKLCGISRPHFFDGVVSILNHFFELIHPKNTFFGLKDYQQFLIVKDFLNQSNLDIAIHGVDIVRERDGLAMSSRNNLLTPNQRLIAKNLSLILNDIYVNIGKYSLSNLRDQNIKKLTNLGFDVDYLSFCDSTSLEEISEIKPNTLVAIAAKLETVRLIDNILIK